MPLPTHIRSFRNIQGRRERGVRTGRIAGMYQHPRPYRLTIQRGERVSLTPFRERLGRAPEVAFTFGLQRMRPRFLIMPERAGRRLFPVPVRRLRRLAWIPRRRLRVRSAEHQTGETGTGHCKTRSRQKEMGETGKYHEMKVRNGEENPVAEQARPTPATPARRDALRRRSQCPDIMCRGG